MDIARPGINKKRKRQRIVLAGAVVLFAAIGFSGFAA
jgi:hypothetical protein